MMTEFEEQVAKALAHSMDWIAARELGIARFGDPVPIGPMAARLARRVAAALEAAADAGEGRQAGYGDRVYEKALAALRGEA